jgi:hypothetical protein
MYVVEYDIDSPITMSDIIGGEPENNDTSTDNQPVDNVSDNTSKTNTIDDKINKYMSVINKINKEYSEFKKNILNQTSELQNITKNDLYLLLPSNDEPYIDNEKISKFMTDKISNKNISIGKNDHLDSLPPFFSLSPKDNIIIET